MPGKRVYSTYLESDISGLLLLLLLLLLLFIWNCDQVRECTAPTWRVLLPLSRRHIGTSEDSWSDVRSCLPQKKASNAFVFGTSVTKSYERIAQALVATRNGLRGLLERTTVATEEEARSLEKFKEQKMGQVDQKIAIFVACYICRLICNLPYGSISPNIGIT